MLQRSTFFLFLKKEKNEIDKLKWIESEKENRDIGWDHAFFVWITKHQSSWRSGIYESGIKK